MGACDVCGGDGECPVSDQRGDTHSYVTCPECCGSGKGESRRATGQQPRTEPQKTASDFKYLAWQHEQRSA